MATGSLRISSIPARISLIAAALLIASAAFFSAKWAFANSLATQTDLAEAALFAADLAPDDPETHFAAAVLAERSFDPGEVERSLRHFETSAALSPNDYLIWLELGRARERAGDAAGAEKTLRYAEILAPHYSRVKWALGNTLIRKSDYHEGVDEIGKALVIDPRFADPAANIVWTIFDGDIAAMRAAIGNLPAFTAALALVLARENKPDEAIKLWNEIPEAERKGALREKGQKLYGRMLELKLFRNARSLAAEAAEGMAEAAGDSGVSSASGARRSIPQQDAITNGGFETAVETKDATIFEWRFGKSGAAKIGISNNEKSSGANSLVIIFPEGSSGFQGITQTIAAEPGKRYIFEAGYRSDLQTISNFRWVIRNAADRSLLAATDPFSANTGWTRASAAFQLPETSDGVVVELEREKCSGAECRISGRLWLDDIVLKPSGEEN